jgi:nickel/cobalt transporter (NiCoT) family protein
MCLLDTTDGALMMTLYTSTSLARDIIAILYYSIVLSAITVLVALCIGIIQLLSLVASFSSGKFWDGVDVAEDHFDIIGGGICGAFVVFGLISVMVYKPWRRWIEKNRIGKVRVVYTAELEVIQRAEEGKIDGTVGEREDYTLEGA